MILGQLRTGARSTTYAALLSASTEVGFGGLAGDVVRHKGLCR